MKVAILSTDNESYMLQWWLPHHAAKFDAGVVVDFNYRNNPDDTTLQLQQKFAPHWKYIKVNEPEVSTAQWDMVLNDVELQVRKILPENSWTMVLNPMEFVIGNLKSLDGITEKKQVLLPCHLMIDDPVNENVEPDVNVSILKQRPTGIPYTNDFPNPSEGLTAQKFYAMEKEYELQGKRFRDYVDHNIRWMRSIHNYDINYLRDSNFGIGRHFWDVENYSKELAICHMTYAPFTEKFVSRKLNVQTRLTAEDRRLNRGMHHFLTKETMRMRKDFYWSLSKDLSADIEALESM